MPRLIVNADDFGLTSGVNRAILDLHQAGVLPSATIMARAPATDEAVEIARATPSLGVGCHIVLLDGDPMSTPAQIPSLADPRTGRFPPTLSTFLKRAFTGQISAQEIEMEARIQIQSLQSRGAALTHIDTHKHTHMFPRVLRPVLRAAHSCGIHAVRNPFEPTWSIEATPGAPFLRRTQVRLLRLLAASFHRIVAEEGFVTTSGALGVLATGTLDTSTINALLQAIPQGRPSDIYELVTHPGYNDAALAAANTRLLSARDTECAAIPILSNTPNLVLLNFTAIRPAPITST